MMQLFLAQQKQFRKDYNSNKEANCGCGVQMTERKDQMS